MTLALPRVDFEARRADGEVDIEIHHIDYSTGDSAEDLDKKASLKVADAQWLTQQVGLVERADFSKRISIPFTKPNRQSRIRGYAGGGLAVAEFETGERRAFSPQRTDAPTDPWMLDVGAGMTQYPFDDPEGWSGLMIKEIVGEVLLHKDGKLFVPNFRSGFSKWSAEELTTYARKVAVDEATKVGMDFSRESLGEVEAEIVAPQRAVNVFIFGTYAEAMLPTEQKPKYSKVSERFPAAWVSKPEHSSLELLTYLFLRNVPNDMVFRDGESSIKDGRPVDLGRKLLSISTALPQTPREERTQARVYEKGAMTGETSLNDYLSSLPDIEAEGRSTLKLAALVGPRYWRKDLFGTNEGLAPILKYQSRKPA